MGSSRARERAEAQWAVCPACGHRLRDHVFAGCIGEVECSDEVCTCVVEVDLG